MKGSCSKQRDEIQPEELGYFTRKEKLRATDLRTEHIRTSEDMPWVKGPAQVVLTSVTKLSQIDRAPIHV